MGVRDNVLPEFLLYFSGTGDYSVNARFPIKDMMVRSGKCEREEAIAFVNQLDAGIISEMTFDEHPFRISKWKQDDSKRTLTLYCESMN